MAKTLEDAVRELAACRHEPGEIVYWDASRYTLDAVTDDGFVVVDPVRNRTLDGLVARCKALLGSRVRLT